MRVSKEIAGSYWESAVMEQTKTNLEADGYTVTQQEKLGNFTADLVARKGEEIIVYEFKKAAWSGQEAHLAAALRKYAVHQLGAGFRFILVTPPQEKIIDIPDIETRLTAALAEHVPNELALLSERTTIESVSDVSITGVAFRPEGFVVSGNGVVHVGLGWEHGKDPKRFKEPFPFMFEAVINGFDKPIVIQLFDVDLETWYGNDDEAEDEPPRADEHDKNGTSGF